MKFLSRIFVPIFGCAHDNVFLPRCGWQRCADCAARRRYRTFGSEPGPWIYEPEVYPVSKEVTDEKKVIPARPAV